MSSVPGSPEDKLYCSTDDVANFFDKFSGPQGATTFSGGFGPDTNPTQSEVELLIEEQTEYIEEETGHAWRAKRMKGELMDLNRAYYFNSGTPFQLMHRDIRELDPAKGDELLVYTAKDSNDGYQNWLTSNEYSEGRNTGDYWVNKQQGTLYVYKAGYFFDRYNFLEVTYRYGKEKVPATVRNACAKLVAADLMRTQQFRVTNPGSEEAPDPANIAEKFVEQANKRLERYKEVRSIGINQ
jgi:hypothetical protein